MHLIRLYTFARREVDRFRRVPIQSLVAPLINGLLFVFIFGFVIGKFINFEEGFSYIDFVFPGILMMSVINGAFGQSSFSLYFQRFTRAIDELLTSPLSYTEMIIGYITGSILRALSVATGLFLIALYFTQASIQHIGLFFFYIILVSALFSLLGIIVALWSEKFEHLSILQIFVISPLIYFGGVFNSINMLPENIQPLAKLNPFFYMVDGLRYSMINYSESNLLIGTIFLCVLTIVLFIAVVHLFKTGYKLRD